MICVKIYNVVKEELYFSKTLTINETKLRKTFYIEKTENRCKILKDKENFLLLNKNEKTYITFVYCFLSSDRKSEYEVLL